MKYYNIYLKRFDKLALSLFLASDLVVISVSVFFGISVILGTVSIWPDFWNIGRDWSLGEIISYIKWLIMIFVFLAAYRRTKEALLLMISLSLMVVLSDDALQIHESAGGAFALALNLHLVLGDVAFQIGELVIWLFLGLVCLLLLYPEWRRAEGRLRHDLIPVGILFLFVVFFAVVVDAVHSIMPERSLIGGVFLILEDGGEMVLISAMLSYSVGRFWGYDMITK